MNNLRHYREKAGLSQGDLSKKTGIVQSGICRVEKGVSDFDGHRWKAIAEALNCSIDELLGHNVKHDER